MGTTLTVLGVVLQVVGGVIAFQGLIKTHDLYAKKTAATIVQERAVSARDRLQLSVDRLLRRRRDVVVTAGPAASVRVSAFDARAIIGFGPLPPETADALRELDRRTRDLMKRSDALDERMAEEVKKARDEIAEVRVTLEAAAEKADEAVRAAAIEGLVREAGGLFLVIIGGALQALGALI